MNASSKPEHLRPPRSRLRRITDAMLGKVVTLLLAAIALALGIATFVLLSGGVRMQLTPRALLVMVLANAVVLLMLGAVLAGRITRVWVERRRGSAGSRLHVRLVLLFSVVAVTPTILVALFATAFFTLGIQAWFNDRVRTALNEGLEASRGYLEEHRNNIRADVLGMANDLSRAGAMLVNDPFAFAQVLQTQTVLRGLTEAIIFEPVTGQIVAGIGAMEGLGVEPAPQSAIEQAKTGEVAVIGSPDDDRVRAVVQLNSTPTLMLLIGRPVDQEILNHMVRTERAVAEYNRLEENRSSLQITFALIFALVALLVLSAAVLIGLVLANQIARPIGGLILAAERVRAGDLAVRVPEIASEDEVAGLSRAFNRMTGQLRRSAAELMDAYSQIDERRRFTETVLAGVSAGRDRPRPGRPHRAAEPGRERTARRRPDGGDRRGRSRTRARVRAAARKLWPSIPSGRARPKSRSARGAAPRTLLVRIGVGPARRPAGRLCGHLRRHHRAAGRPAQGGLGATWRAASPTRSRTR